MHTKFVTFHYVLIYYNNRTKKTILRVCYFHIIKIHFALANDHIIVIYIYNVIIIYIFYKKIREIIIFF